MNTENILGRTPCEKYMPENASFYEIIFYSLLISRSNAALNSQPEDGTSYVGTGMNRNCVKWHPVVNGTERGNGSADRVG